MDPLTQIAAGATMGALLAKRSEVPTALVVGAIAGGLPDLDIFIRSAEDPLLALKYHRHFTHAFVFAPVIGLMVAFATSFFCRGDHTLCRLWLFATLGAFSHGLIDACTSYGTYLYLPFSDHRESWDIISIIDPVFTVPVALLLFVAFWVRLRRCITVAFLFAISYLAIGCLQNIRADAVLAQIADENGHVVIQASVRPSFGNIILWRLVYRSGDTYHINAVTIWPFTEPKIYAGASVPAFQREVFERSTGLPANSQQSKDIERFREFSQDYLSLHPDRSDVVGDIRYALSPDSIRPLWGIRVDPQHSDRHVTFENYRDDVEASFDRLFQMLMRR